MDTAGTLCAAFAASSLALNICLPSGVLHALHSFALFAICSTQAPALICLTCISASTRGVAIQSSMCAAHVRQSL